VTDQWNDEQRRTNVTTDRELKDEVMRELEWDPQVNATHIGVAVKDGAVTLTGHASSYAEKWAAIRAAERVYGVRAVADEITVKLPSTSVRDDQDLAEQIARTLRWNTIIPDTVSAEVRKGVVLLRGEVEMNFQKEEAERAIRSLTGIVGVTNLVTVKPRVKPDEVQKRIEEAIVREADLDARQIGVLTTNGTVKLRGYVHSLWEKKLAEKAASAAPGVSKVENQLAVIP